MRNRRNFAKAWVVCMTTVAVLTLLSVMPAFSKNKPAPIPPPPENVYQTVPIALQMEAGNTQWNPWTSGTTIIAGTGWIAPFGRSDYHYGFGYAEDADRPDFTGTAGWANLFLDSKFSFCIYHLEDGDVYAYGGIVANIEPETDDGKTDYILEVIVGGTGKYKNANGLMLGRTAGRGAAVDFGGFVPLPPVIIKMMEGYINIEVKESDYNPSLPAIGTRNPQLRTKTPRHMKLEGLIPLNIEFEAGRDQWNPYPLGDEYTTTFIAGTGWIEPFGRADYHYGANFPESREGGEAPKPDFMDDSWLSLFPTNNLCVYDLGDGLIYAYDGIMGNLEPDSEDGKADYILEVIVGGTEDYAGASGILIGHTTGRGDAAVPTSGDASGPFPLPDSILKIMEGYIIK